MKQPSDQAIAGLPLFDPSWIEKTAQNPNVPAISGDPERDQDTDNPFPSEIKRWGEIWILESAHERAALYKLTDDHDGDVGWVVLRHRVYTKERKAFETVYPVGSFRVPSSEDFGRYAWNFLNTKRGRENALRKLDELTT